VTKGLEAARVKWTRNARLVRGLDYYRHTAFEFVTDRLGSQGAVIAGGRYDGLIESLGGPHTPAVGWAAGIERLMELADLNEMERPDIGLIDESGRSDEALVKIAASLRRANISFVGPFRGKPKRQFELVTKARAKARLNLRRWEPNTALTAEALTADDPVIATIRYGFDSEIDAELSSRVFNALGQSFQVTSAVGSDGVILLRDRAA
jgi:histidyl-tRNA synthetase